MNQTSEPKPLKIVKGHPIFKNGIELKKGVIQFIDKYAPDYGDIFYVNTVKEEIAVINHPDYAKHIFQDNNKNYQKSYGYRVLSIFLGNGLLTSEGDFWLKQRRLVQPAFHRERLTKLAEEMILATERFKKELVTKSNNNIEINLSDEFSTLALEIVSRSLFTSSVSKDDLVKITLGMHVANEFAIQKIFEIIPIPLWVPTSSHINFKKASENMDAVIRRIITERRDKKELHHDLLAMLMETQDEDTGEKMSDRQIRDEAMTIYLAGHETTAVALSWFFYMMSIHPEVEEKIRQEARSLFPSGSIHPSDVHKLTYTKMVIDEVLRFFPPAWILGRKAIEDDVIGGYRIPKGFNVLVVPYLIHRLPEFWERPNEFIPERFSPDKTKLMHKFAYFPFGGGPRQCIGNNFALMEMQIIVASLIRDFTFERTSSEEPIPEQLVTLRMKGGLEVMVKKVD